MTNRSNVKYAVDLLTSVAIIVACAVVVWIGIATRTANREAEAASNPSRSIPVEDITGKDLVINVAEAPRLGSNSSTISLIEFSDFECPFCRRFTQETFDDLKTGFIDTGVISYSYIHHPLTRIHRNALNAATVAECADDQGKFWGVHAGLFRAAASPGLTNESIAAVAREARLDRERLDRCVPTVAERIQRDLHEAERLGVRSTPTFFVGVKSADGHVALRSRINGAQPLDVFASVINDLKKQSGEGGS